MVQNTGMDSLIGALSGIRKESQRVNSVYNHFALMDFAKEINSNVKQFLSDGPNKENLSVTIGLYNDEIERVPRLIFVMYLGETEFGHGRAYDLNLLCPFYECQSSKVVCISNSDGKNEMYAYGSEPTTDNENSDTLKMIFECPVPLSEIENLVSKFYSSLKHQ